jgi:hypothetical protein
LGNFIEKYPNVFLLTISVNLSISLFIFLIILYIITRIRDKRGQNLHYKIFQVVDQKSDLKLNSHYI